MPLKLKKFGQYNKMLLAQYVDKNDLNLLNDLKCQSKIVDFDSLGTGYIIWFNDEKEALLFLLKWG